MAINVKPVYRCILLKLSDEVLQGSEGLGIDTSTLDRMTQKIKELVELNTQVGVVTDDGNLFRDAGLAKMGMNRVMGGHMGMLVTVVNGLTMCDVLYHTYVNTRLTSVVPLDGVYGNYNWAGAINLLRNNYVVVLPVGTGNPFFTTDSATYLCGIEIEADVVLRAIKVDGVFIVGPAEDPTATVYEQLIYTEVLGKGLEVIDLAAFTLTRDRKLPIRVSGMNRPGTLRRVVMGEKEGTLITE